MGRYCTLCHTQPNLHCDVCQVDRNQRVYLHAMDSDLAIDAQRRMQLAGHTTADPKNVPCVLMTGEDKVWGCFHFPVTMLLIPISHHRPT